MEFADRLVSALTERGFEPYIDRKDILAGEDWTQRLGTLIAGADSIILILSPSAVTSEITQWEIRQAERFGKRLFPIVWRRFDPSQAPPHINDINWIFFDDPNTFSDSLDRLATALEIDLPWIREHTRLLQRAMEWEAGGRPESRLLFGRDIESAERWASRRPRTAPDIPTLVLDFIRASVLGDKSRTQTENERKELIETLLPYRDRAQKERDWASEIAVLKKRLEKYEGKEKARRRNQNRIFINYRRSDSGPWAGWIHERLLRDFGSRRLFMDIDSISSGRKFGEVLEESMTRCGSMLTIIGKEWIDARNENGSRRLDDPNDYVRREIATALNREILVVPLLVGGAELPSADILPAELRPLRERQARPVTLESFSPTMQGVIRDIRNQLRGTWQQLLLKGFVALALLALLIITLMFGISR
jgi:hypothetical protein